MNTQKPSVDPAISAAASKLGRLGRGIPRRFSKSHREYLAEKAAARNRQRKVGRALFGLNRGPGSPPPETATVAVKFIPHGFDTATGKEITPETPAAPNNPTGGIGVPDSAVVGNVPPDGGELPPDLD